MSQLHTLRYNPSGKHRYWRPFIPSYGEDFDSYVQVAS